MNIKEWLDAWVFNRDLAAAKAKFAKVRRSSIYNQMPDRSKRGLIKEVIRAAGFKKIRIKERVR